MGQRESQRAEVRSNYQAFLSDLPRLVLDSQGRYAVYRHQRLIDVFDSFSAAITFGNRMYSDRVFSVQEITEEPLELGGLAYVAGTRDV
jgi:hypothetical protein